MYKWVYGKAWLVSLLTHINRLAVAFCAAELVLYLGYVFLSSVSEGVSLLFAAFIPFMLVSVMRKLINLKRPYEVYDLSEISERDPGSKAGHSFPSRHVFSCILIGTLIFPYSVVFSAMTLIFGILLGVARVLLGIHFVRDVLTGAILGAIGGIIGILIL